MTTTEAARTLSAQLTIARSGTQSNIEIHTPDLLDPIALRGASEWDQITAIGPLVAARLERTVRANRQLTLGIPARDRLLGELHDIGTNMWVRLLGRYRALDPTIGLGTVAEAALLSLEFGCPSDLILPVELLPVLEPVPDGSSPDKGLQKAATMAGFGARTQRQVLQERPPGADGPLDATAVCFYWDAHLPGAKEEWKALSKRFGDGLLGPNPMHRKTSATQIADRIINTPRRTGSDGPRSAIEHFSCHHVRGKAGPDGLDRVWLRTKGLFAPRIAVSADHLIDNSLGKPPKGGLVFLNACSTQVLTSSAVSSIVNQLHQLGRTSIVATWCDVPDPVAVAMSKYFYEGIYKLQYTVGEALRYARLQLLLVHKNPLGILYTIYGDADYRVVG